MIVFLCTLPIRLYRWTISPWLTPACRYLPSCSEYCCQAIETHGMLKGGLLGLKRLCRCHPWGSSGFDPVPEKKSPRKPH
jgi:hypothetical protein